MVKSHFREFQFSRLMLGIVLPMELLIAIFYVLQIGDQPLSLNGFILLSALMLVILCIFYGMTTTVDDREVKVTFGIGLIRRKINLDDVRSVESVKNPWYYGYGIRWIRNGWLYNVSGAEAVELTFKGKNNVVRIGTKTQEALKEAIQTRITV